MTNQQVAIYKGDTLLCEGTVRQCAKTLNVQIRTIKFYLTPSYMKRLEQRKNLDKSRFVVRI